MKQFLLGLMTGVLLMLLRELPSLAWHRPMAIKHALLKSYQNVATISVASVAFGVLMLTTGKKPLDWSRNCPVHPPSFRSFS